MYRQLTHLTTLTLTVLLLTTACPNNEDGTETELEQNMENAWQSTEQAGEQAIDEVQEEADQLGDQVAESVDGSEVEQAGEAAGQTLDRAGDEISEEWGQFTAEVREEYPQLVRTMENQLEALNNWSVERYRATFTEDSPDRDELVEAFETVLPNKPRYEVESFKVESASDTQAVATAVIRTTPNAEDAATVETRTYRYTFVPESEGDDWLVQSAEEISAGSTATETEEPPAE